MLAKRVVGFDLDVGCVGLIGPIRGSGVLSILGVAVDRLFEDRVGGVGSSSYAIVTADFRFGDFLVCSEAEVLTSVFANLFLGSKAGVLASAFCPTDRLVEDNVIGTGIGVSDRVGAIAAFFAEDRVTERTGGELGNGVRDDIGLDI